MGLERRLFRSLARLWRDFLPEDDFYGGSVLRASVLHLNSNSRARFAQILLLNPERAIISV